MNFKELAGQELDFAMYQHACQVSGKAADKKEFEVAYEQGKFHFHQDKLLLLDLIETYKINVQFLADEWLASTQIGSAWGNTPLIAVCRLVLTLNH